MRRSIASALILALLVPIASADHVVVKTSEAQLTFVGGHEGTGNDVADAGDVNGDGTNDLLIGTSDNAGEENVGRAYVLWGGNTGSMTPQNMGSRGFEIRSHQPGDLLGQAVTGIGDLDGDGRAEFAVSAPWADPQGRTNAGSVYVVFGGGLADPLVTDDLGSRAIRIDGAIAYEFAGGALGSAGDVDGDGVPDLLIGAPGMGHTHVLAGGGGAYLLSGATLTDDIDLAQLGERGFVMSSDVDDAQAGWSVAGAGDMNGDDLDEVVVGAPAEFHETTPGRAFVVFGKSDRGAVDLESLGSGGWTIESSALNDATGRAVAGGRDVNGDAIPDLVVGSPRTPDAEGLWVGAAHVVFGKADVEPVTLGSAGAATLTGAGGQSGWSVALAPSSRGAPVADVLVGAPFKRQGRVYQVFGGAVGEGLALGDLGPHGFRYAGTIDLGRFGNSVAPIGEEVLIGESDGMDESGTLLPGAAYLMRPTNEDLTHPKPEMYLVSYDAHQDGKEGSFCWETGCVDIAPSVPERAREVGRGDLGLIGILNADRPDGFSLTAYEELDEFGRPAGDATELDVRLTRRGAVFRFPRSGDELYLVAAGQWNGSGDMLEYYRVVLGEPYRSMGSAPRSYLHAGGRTQMYSTQSYYWQNCRFNGYCVATVSDVAARTGPRSSIPALHGSRASVRIRTPYPPDRLRLSEHFRLDPGYWPAGRGRTVDARLRPRVVEGERVAWELNFPLPESGERVFYVLSASWKGHGGIYHDFHVRLR